MDRDRFRRAAVTVVLVLLAPLTIACDDPASTTDRMQGVYDDEELDHFFSDAELLLRERLGWTEIGDVRG